MSTYDIGDVAVLNATFTPYGGNPTNPDAVTLTIKKRDQTVITPTLTNPAPGVYRAVVPIDNVPGLWWCRWVGTGDAAAAEEVSITVTRSRVL